MSKKKNVRADDPVVVSIDDLAVATDEELAGRANRLEAERTRCKDPYTREVEIAYVRREQQIRRVRAEAHAAYLSTVPREEVEPVNYDFDAEEEVA